MTPRVIAHRGASGYAHENSMAAFREAAARGADGVELDVHATSDGVLLVHHDPAIGGLGPIGLQPVRHFTDHRLPNGEPLPTLVEALTALNGLDVWVEVKGLRPDADARLLAVLAQGPTPARYAVHSFDHRIIARLGELQPELRRGALLASYLLDNAAVVRGAGADTLWMETQYIDRNLVEELHAEELQVIGWTANSEAEIRRLAALGVDGICGNYPDRIRAIVGPA